MASTKSKLFTEALAEYQRQSPRIEAAKEEYSQQLFDVQWERIELRHKLWEKGVDPDEKWVKH